MIEPLKIGMNVVGVWPEQAEPAWLLRGDEAKPIVIISAPDEAAAKAMFLVKARERLGVEMVLAPGHLLQIDKWVGYFAREMAVLRMSRFHPMVRAAVLDIEVDDEHAFMHHLAQVIMATDEQIVEAAGIKMAGPKVLVPGQNGRV